MCPPSCLQMPPLSCPLCDPTRAPTLPWQSTASLGWGRRERHHHWAEHTDAYTCACVTPERGGCHNGRVTMPHGCFSWAQGLRAHFAAGRHCLKSRRCSGSPPICFPFLTPRKGGNGTSPTSSAAPSPTTTIATATASSTGGRCCLFRRGYYFFFFFRGHLDFLGWKEPQINGVIWLRMPGPITRRGGIAVW